MSQMSDIPSPLLAPYIRRNSIFDNSKGIDPCLTSPIDPGDDGSNGGLNYPVITSAKTSRRATVIKATLDSVAGQGYALEFFANPAALSGSSSYSHDEGKTFKAERPVTTDINGHASFSFKLKWTEKIPAKQYVTATATRTETKGTSEFSLPVLVKRQ
jgi:hypothetical protein